MPRFIRQFSGYLRAGALVAAVAAITIGSAGNASAQGLSDILGNIFRPVIRPAPPPAMDSFADPFGPGEREPGERRAGGYGGGGGGTYCVRLCDGRYFPVQRGSGNAAQTCSAFCPASKTQVFSGGNIDGARAPNGERYGNLDTAYLYREKVVSDCTCNGRDPFGLARVDVNDDPTLRPGDIVATPQGLMAANGKRGEIAFTPIDRTKLARDARLAATKVAPAPEEPSVDSEVQGAVLPEEPRRAQLVR